jgi:hypothetical protein
MGRFLDFIGKVIGYFVLLGLLGRFAVDVLWVYLRGLE